MTNSGSLPQRRTEFAFDFRDPTEAERLSEALQAAHHELEMGRMNSRTYRDLVLHLAAKLGALNAVRHGGPGRDVPAEKENQPLVQL